MPFDRYLEPLFPAREPRIQSYLQRLADFRDWTLTQVDAQANYTDRYAPPVLEPYDREGGIANRVVVNPWYEGQHQEAYRRGVIGLPYREGAPHLLSFTMGYLLSQADASLHCPVTLTGAVAYLLGYHAEKDLRLKYLDGVTRMDGSTTTGGTWATEEHGGSDIGATTTVAVAENNHFLLRGLKWFASNAGSGLAVATARPKGADGGVKGLGLYLVPGHLEDGTPNHYRIRRLKDKLGTRGLPTGEIELADARAIEMAPPPRGFKLMMEALEYSRIHNAVGAAGVQRRSLDEALKWAGSRQAFGHRLIDFPMVLDELLGLRVRFEASALLAFESAFAFDASLRDENQRTWLRFATALAKYRTAEDAVRASRAALELIGGNGYTSDYPMARVLRDAHVLPVWEGPANIQALELMRLLTSYRAGALYEARAGEILGRLPSALSELRRRLEQRLEEDCAAIKFVTGDAQRAEIYARRLLDRLSRSVSFALMCEVAGEAYARGDSRRNLTAMRYYEEIEPAKIGGENRQVREAAASLIAD